jgi:uncharacterized RDD family membrane protein YckC/uncharacterized membrane protein SpoIIM required for sporulation
MIDIERWVAEREDRWRRMAELLDLADDAPLRALGPAGMRELLGLYRLVSSDLNQARSLTANPELLGRLNALTGRGYRFIYRARRPAAAAAGEMWRRAASFVGRDVPAAFRREAAAVALAAGAMLLGVVFGASAMVARPGAAVELIPGQFFTESPRQRVESIESSKERVSTVAEAAIFGSQLYTHNIQVAFLVFSLGALTLAGAIPLLFYNGVLLGAIGASYVLDGVSAFFFGWVGPHGAFELAAIAFARRSRAPGLPARRPHDGGGHGPPGAGRPHRGLVLAVLGAGGAVSAEDRGGGGAALVAAALPLPAAPAGRPGGRRRMSRERLVLTPEHVPIVLVPAGVGSRFLALVVDLALMLAAIAAASAVIRLILPGGVGVAVITTLAFVLSWGYHVYFETRHQGRSPGKRAAGLRVVDGRGLPVTVEQSFVRNVVRALDFLPVLYGVGGLAALLDRDRRRLGDILADTLVVRERMPSAGRGRLAGAAARLAAAPRANALADPATRRRIRHRLTLAERELLLDLCLRADRLEPRARYDLMEEVGAFYRRKLEIDLPHLSAENLVRDLTALAFGQP